MTIKKLLFPLVALPSRQLHQVSVITHGYMRAQELRISSIARNIEGNTDSAYRMISRFLEDLETFDEIISRLLLSNAPFVIGDPTIVEKKYSRKTSYIGYVRPEKKGYYLLTFGAPFKGRTIVFGIHTYSPATIAEECSSRNIEHTRGLAEIVNIIGDLPVIFASSLINGIHLRRPFEGL